MKFTQATIILALLNTSANAALRGRQTRSNGQTEAYRQQEEAIQSDIVFEEVPDDANMMTADMGGEDPEMELEMKVEMMEVPEEEKEEIPAKSDAEIVYKEGLAPPDINDMGEGDGLDKCDGLMAADSPEYERCMGATIVTPIEDSDEPIKMMENDEIPITNPDMASAAQKFTFEDEEFVGVGELEVNGKKFSVEMEGVNSMGETPDEPIPTSAETADAKTASFVGVGDLEVNGKKFSVEMEDVDSMGETPDAPIPTYAEMEMNGKKISVEMEDVDSMGETPDAPIPTYTESAGVVESDTGKKFSFDIQEIDTEMNAAAAEVASGHHVVTKSITYEFDDGTSVTETIKENI